MRICGIYDQNDVQKIIKAYLLYFEQSDQYYIEIPEGTDKNELPMMLGLFAQKGHYTVESQWSERWVQSRIIPSERQNLGGILRENHLKVYHTFKLLMLSRGICCQDDFYVEELENGEIPVMIMERMKCNIKDILISGDRLVIFFQHNMTRIYDVKDLLLESDIADYVKNHFGQVSIESGGYGISWNGVTVCMARDLLDQGEEIPVMYEDFCHFATDHVLNTTEVCEMMKCTRQNVDDLIKRNKLHPIKSAAKNKMFLKSEVESRLW